MRKSCIYADQSLKWIQMLLSPNLKCSRKPRFTRQLLTHNLCSPTGISHSRGRLPRGGLRGSWVYPRSDRRSHSDRGFAASVPACQSLLNSWCISMRGIMHSPVITCLCLCEVEHVPPPAKFFAQMWRRPKRGAGEIIKHEYTCCKHYFTNQPSRV